MNDPITELGRQIASTYIPHRHGRTAVDRLNREQAILSYLGPDRMEYLEALLFAVASGATADDIGRFGEAKASGRKSAFLERLRRGEVL